MNGLYPLVLVVLFSLIVHYGNSFDDWRQAQRQAQRQDKPYHPIKIKANARISNPGRFKPQPKIRAKPDVVNVKETAIQNIKPFSHMATPVMVEKTAKFIKVRKPRVSSMMKPDKEELRTLKLNSGNRLRLTWIELAQLKTLATKQGTDDWLSLIDSKLNYEENKENFIRMHGAADSDNELLQKYNRYEEQISAHYRRE